MSWTDRGLPQAARSLPLPDKCHHPRFNSTQWNVLCLTGPFKRQPDQMHMKQKDHDMQGTVTRVKEGIVVRDACCPIQSITTAHMGICCKKNELTEETVTMK